MAEKKIFPMRIPKYFFYCVVLSFVFILAVIFVPKEGQDEKVGLGINQGRLGVCDRDFFKRVLSEAEEEISSLVYRGSMCVKFCKKSLTRRP